MFSIMSHFAQRNLRRIGTLMARAALAALLMPAAALAGRLPPGFVYLRDVAPGIAQDMRYAGANNFTGRPLPGYDAPECVLKREVAEALARVAADLATAKTWAEGLRLLSPDARGLRLRALGAQRRRRHDQALLSQARQTPAVRARLYRVAFGAFDRHRRRSHAGAAAGAAGRGLRARGALRPLHRAGGQTRARQFARPGHRLRLLRRQERTPRAARITPEQAPLTRPARRRDAQARLPQLFPRMVALLVRPAPGAGLRFRHRAASLSPRAQTRCKRAVAISATRTSSCATRSSSRKRGCPALARAAR